MTQLILQPGRERSLLRRHPWLFAGSVARLDGHARSGDTVIVVSSRGEPLGKAAYSPESQIRARMWSFDPNEIIDDAFFKRRVEAALARRGLPGLQEQAGLRLIHGESDGLPGVICDCYGDMLVLQLTSAGADRWRKALLGALRKALPKSRVYERSDSEVRSLEGLERTSGCLHGEPPQAPVNIEENGLKFAVDVVGGHKTGFYLDQRDNRRLLRELAGGRDVLDCFCYTGGFALSALAGGAESVTAVDSSRPALEAAQRNLGLNLGLTASRARWQDADVFAALREYRATGRQFNLIVLDPPKFAPSAGHAESAARAYKDINMLGFRLLSPGGLLMTFSCSGGVSPELFQKIVAGAAVDAGVDARILRKLGPGADHPVGLAFPEGEYLKGLLCQVG
jgi:23S rRNA (cytosine1962-C5)-methyltransferase